MERDFFMETKRIGFSRWKTSDLELAERLWGEAEVTRFLCAAGVFTRREIAARLQTELEREEWYRVQYWPIFERESVELIGCCGLRPAGAETAVYELGFHLRRPYWGKGYACEAAGAVIAYGFRFLVARRLTAGHHPQNDASRRLLTKLGFRLTGEQYYEPTGLLHPSYELTPE